MRTYFDLVVPDARRELRGPVDALRSIKESLVSAYSRLCSGLRMEMLMSSGQLSTSPFSYTPLWATSLRFGLLWKEA